MAQETLKELRYDGSKVIAEVARRDGEGNKIPDTYLTNVQVISEDEIGTAFESVFGENTTVKKLLDATKSARDLFDEYEGTSVDGLIKYNDTSNVTDMSSMFHDCIYLTTIPLLDTSNVIYMSHMFYFCSRLTSIPLLNTSKVISMEQMFAYCRRLTSIPELDTSKVSNMSSMFFNCSSLITIPLLNTSNVTNMSSMFAYCINLTSIPLLDTSKVTDMSSMFNGCSNLTKISMINIGADLDIHYCTKMTREALLEVLGNLKDLTGQTSKTLTLGSTLLAKLTDDDKAIATNKNWTLA